MKLFLAGLGIGVGLGVLFAPNSGEATRRRVRDRLAALLDDLRPQLDKAKNVVQETMAAASEGSTEKDEHATSDFPSKKDQAKEVRSSASSDSINTVSREELLNVNGIGPVLADRIVSGRPYASSRELVERGILSQSTYEELERELSRREKFSA